MPVDPVDQELVRAVDLGLPWTSLLHSASCRPEEAEGRIFRLLMTGYLEGTPGDERSPTAREPSAPAARPGAPSSPARPSHAPARPAQQTGSTHAIRPGAATGSVPRQAQPGSNGGVPRQTQPDRVSSQPPRGSAPSSSPGSRIDPRAPLSGSHAGPRASTQPPRAGIPRETGVQERSARPAAAREIQASPESTAADRLGRQTQPDAPERHAQPPQPSSSSPAPRSTTPPGPNTFRQTAATQKLPAVDQRNQSSAPPDARSSAPPPTGAMSARESLLRELVRRSGVGFSPIDGNSSARSSSIPPSVEGNMRGYHKPASSTPPATISSTPPAGRSEPAPRDSFPTPVGYPSEAPRSASASSSGYSRPVHMSPLVALIDEFSHGEGMQRWAAARLREVLHEENAGNYLQAVSVLQMVMAQIEDLRVRTERDRIQARMLQSSSGIHRTRAMEAENNSRHREAAEHWRKVLEAFPNDAEAALHAAMCMMEAGDLKQAGLLAKRAVELAPNSINAHKILLRFFKKAGMEMSAKRETEILQKLKKA